MRLLSLVVLSSFSLMTACKPGKDTADSQTGTLDDDNDGYAASEDCDDNDAAINPGATEICNELDDNCDSVIDTDATDTTTYYLDADADGYGVPDTESTVSACSAPEGYAALTDDCDDANADYHPGADESDCSDPNDYNCDGSAGAVDNDADGFFACEECDDGNTAVNPLAAEVCNDIDDNCDTVTDTDAVDAPTWYTDADSDTYGDSATAVISCEAPAGTVAVDGDCDDTSTSYNPAADESDCADPNDYNCDGSVGYVDADGDGFAACTECDDSDGAINSSAAEACDGVDNNCDGTIDEAGAIGETTWYLDADADGYGDATASVVSCSAPEGYVADSTDCDDTLATFHPGADESDCTDPADYNCDGSVGYADADGDGTAACEDCDDANPEAYPGGVEVCDGADNDCDTTVDVAAVNATVFYADVDADSYGDASARLESCEASVDGFVTNDTDCDDGSAAYNPGADESDCADPNDYNCDGSVGYVDADGDGYAACSECNDEDGAINTDATEACDGVDNNCDGTIDEAGATGETTWFLDADSDGFGDPTVSVVSCSAPEGYVADSTDCDDSLATFHPGADESDCTDPNDYNCDGSVGYADADGDGTAACEDCDDLNAEAYPGGVEVCDGADNNCDTNTDESSALDATAWYADSDGDTFGAAAITVNACAQPDGFVADDTDCDDARDSDFPGADEVCDNHDNDCDGSVDTDALDANAYYADSDDDGYGDVTDFTAACSAPSGYIEDASDCDDAEVSANPAGVEICDSIDNDCDGFDDNNAVDAPTWYADADSDDYGDAFATIETCAAPLGYVANNTDCDDLDSGTYPSADELCDSVDNDCDSFNDEGAIDANTYYADSDDDGYGDVSSSTAACSAPSGYIEDASDCEDTESTTFPGAAESCDGVDNDCDGSIDDSAIDANTYYADSDSDTFGDASVSTDACSAPANYVSNSVDCNDSTDSAYPGAAEVCDSVDNDCDGSINNAAIDAITYYADTDGDNYGDASVYTDACSAPGGYVADDTDCDDSVTTTNPGATESCDSVDNDCDEATDEAGATGETTYYLDNDLDGYGGSTTQTQCNAPSGYISSGDDCDDDDATSYPTNTEVCEDYADNDCDASGADCRSSTLTTIATAVSDSSGFTIYGGQAKDYLGSSLARDADVNGDGTLDLVLGAYGWDSTASTSNYGRTYVWYGPVTAADTVGTADLIYTGAENGESAGSNVAVLPDYVGSSGDEVAIGAWKRNYGSPSVTDSGAVYIFQGGAASATVASAYTTIYGTAVNENAGYVVLGGNYDGNTTTDVLVTAPSQSSTPYPTAGTVNVWYDGVAAGAVSIAAAEYRITGTTSGDFFGYAASTGDINADGVDDFVVGAYGVNNGTTADVGAAYIQFGDGSTGSLAAASMDLVYTNTTSGVANDRVGLAVAMLGDVTGDGYGDVGITADKFDAGGTDSGRVFLFDGGDLSVTTIPSTADIRTAATSTLDGAANDFFGRTLAAAGDFDDDGYADFLVGATGYDNSTTADVGKTFIEYGGPDFVLPTYGAWRGAAAGDSVGYGVSGLGDLDADGYADLGVTSIAADNGAVGDVGTAWIVFGTGQ